MFISLVALLLHSGAASHANVWTCTEVPLFWRNSYSNSGLIWQCPPNSYLNGYLHDDTRASDGAKCGDKDGQGACVSSIKSLRCCKISAAVDVVWDPTSGPEGVVEVTPTFWSQNANFNCPTEYFMTGFNVRNYDTLDALGKFYCVRPKGPVGSIASYELSLPAGYRNPGGSGVWLVCNIWNYVTGMHTFPNEGSNVQWSDIFDASFMCAPASDASCGGAPPRSNMTYLGNSSCTHQNCTLKQTCLAGYAPANSVTNNITCLPSTDTSDFRWTGNTLICQDFDECRRICNTSTEKASPINYGCNTCNTMTATCSNTIAELGGFTCACKPGYSGDGRNCTSQANCIRPCQSSQGETPLSAPSNYPCNDCSLNANCIEQDPWFNCSCKSGFGPLPNCPDINECAKNCTSSEQTDCNRCDPQAICTNTNGGYTCACGPGWNGAGFNCSDIDECSYPLCNGNNAPCYQCAFGSKCENGLNGTSYKCVCAAGFESNGQGGCANINECNVSSTCGNAACVDLSPSYVCGPRFNFIAIDGTPLNSTAYTLSSSGQAPPQIISFVLRNVTGNFSFLPPAYYGDSQNPLRYPLTNCTSMNQRYNCTLGPGAGKNLFMSIIYNSTFFTGTQVFSDTTRLFSYPRPTLVPGTLRTATTGGATSLTIPLIFGTASVVYMNGTNLPSNKLDLAVTYGSSNYPCVVQSSFPDTLACTVGSQTGREMTFSLVAGHGAQAWTANGTDTLTLTVAGPSILNLTGCSACTSTKVYDCPTAGRVPLTVTLDLDIVPPILMLIGGSSCLDSRVLNNRTFTCMLPAGAGTDLLVTVGQLSVFSPALPLLSYVRPTVTALFSEPCTQAVDAFHLRDCPLDNPTNSLLTIRGKDFGSSPSVLIGSQSFVASFKTCAVLPNNDDSSSSQCIVVTLPTYSNSRGSHTQPVNILQENGQLSDASMTISFRALCGVGTYENQNTCVPCPQGTFSTAVGALCNTSCVACAPGAWQPNVGSSSCQLCIPGFFQPASGATECAQCSPGTFSKVFGEVECEQCPPGTYTSVSNQTACVECPKGNFQPYENQTGCLPCTVGFYADATAQVVCKACAPGYWNSMNASSSCSPCLPGTYSKESNATSCTSCEEGSYSNAQAWSVDCQLCSPGRYLNTSSSNTVCFPCEFGTFQTDPGSANCSLCDEGYWSLSGASMCQACSVGSYSEGGVSTCRLCDPGFFQSEIAQSDCEGCVPGRWNRDPGSSSCFGCDVGDYSDSSNATRCYPCPAGSYSKVEFATSCLECGVGQYQPSTGQAVCLDCPAGRIGTESMAADCENCEVGSFSVLPRSTVCQNCSVGMFQNGVAQSSCNECDEGHFVDYEQAEECRPCAAGRRSVSVSASSACVDCEYGTVSMSDGAVNCTECELGKYSNTSGQTVCTNCEIGHFLANSSVQTCLPCPLGSFTPAPGASACQGCPVGKFSLGGGLGSATLTCENCPSGTYAATIGSTGCQNCSVGNYSKASGLSTCTVCFPTEVSSREGSTTCTVCKSNSYPNTARSLCLCSVGFYGYLDSQGYLQCQKCTNEMVCKVAGLMDYEVGTAPGWWRPNKNFEYLRCPNEQFCLGGVGEVNSCLPHHLGPLCGLCEENYQSAGGSACAACDSRASNLAQATLVFIAMIVLASIGFYLVLRISNLQSKHVSNLITKDEQTTKDNIKMQLEKYNTQDVAAQAHDELADDIDFTVDSPETYDTLGALRRRKSSIDNRPSILSTYQNQPLPLLLKTRQTPNFVFKIKIMVGFFQIAAILPAQGGIQWPKHFVDFITIFSFFNFDFMPWQSLGCVATIDYYDKVLIVGCTPFVVLVFLLLFFYIPVMVKDEASIEDQLERQLKHARTTRQLVKLLLFTIFLLYPFVSKTVMGVFNCVRINDNSFLLADLSLTCFSAQWTKYACLAGFFVLCYPIGTPLIYYVLLRNNRKNLKAPTTLFMLGFLYEAYTAQCFYWELLDMFHKLVLTSLVIFLPSILQLGSSMIVLILYLELLLWLQPYIRKGDDRFHQLVQIELYLFCLMGFMLSPPNSIALESATEVLVSVLLIALVVFLLSSFVIIAGRNVQKLFKQYRLARTPSAAPAPVPVHESEISLSSPSISAQRNSQQLRPSSSQQRSGPTIPAPLPPSPQFLLPPALPESLPPLADSLTNKACTD